jgi:alkaline phosphatase D
MNGLEASYLLPLEGGDQMQVILLDERWNRDPIPCQVRRGWCENVLSSHQPDPNALAFCSDFLLDDGSQGIGSCCSKDEKLAVWCEGPGREVEDPFQRGLWPVVCDETNAEMWGMRRVALNPHQQLVLVTEDLFQHNQSELWNPWLVSASPVCEVLGPRQRSWLMRELESSQAPLRVIGSGSVLFGSLNYTGSEGTCSGDDLLCYPQAMVNILHTISSVSTGCVIVAVGDFHYSDLKVVLPGTDHPYSSILKTKTLRRPVWQVMSSGMTDSTASSVDEPCLGTYREDLVGLRPLGRCSFFSRPSFATIDVEVSSHTATMSIIDGLKGKVAVSQDGTRLSVTISLSTCLPI